MKHWRPLILTICVIFLFRQANTADDYDDTEETFGIDFSKTLLPVCRTTDWSDEETEVRCRSTETETYIERIGAQVSRRCCPRNLTKQERDVEKQVAQNCKVIPCQNIGANPWGQDLCSGLPTRYVPKRDAPLGGEFLTYKEAVRESCRLPGSSKLEMAVEAVCCPESSGSPAIYNDFYIITAAHCVVNEDTRIPTPPHFLTVIVGSNIALLENRHLHPGFREIVQTHVHPNYSGLLRKRSGAPKCVLNDIALLRVNKPIEFGDHTKAIKLAPTGFQPELYGSHAISAGWGIGTNLQYLPHLSKTNLKLRSEAVCFHGVGATFPWNVTCPFSSESRDDQFLCVGGLAKGEEMTDLANPINPVVLGEGNSGSPIVCRDQNGDSFLCGIVSSGGSYPNCLFSRTEKGCRFTRAAKVTHFRPFIESIAGNQEKSQLFAEKSFGQVVTDPSEFPHQVYIISSTKRCSGTLVRRNVVVTTAHCVTRQNRNLRILITVFKPEDIKVFARSKRPGETWIPQPYLVKSVHIATGFRPLVFQNLVLEAIWKDRTLIYNFTLPLEHEVTVNDLAVLILTREVDIEPEQLAVLPRVSQLGIQFASGVSAVALSVPRKGRPDVGMLLKENVRILSLAESRERFSRAFLPYTPDSILCGVEKHSGGSICDRTFGGAVIRRFGVGRQKKDIFIGAVSLRPCQHSHSFLMTSTRLLTSWIERVIRQDNPGENF